MFFFYFCYQIKKGLKKERKAEKGRKEEGRCGVGHRSERREGGRVF